VIARTHDNNRLNPEVVHAQVLVVDWFIDDEDQVNPAIIELLTSRAELVRSQRKTNIRIPLTEHLKDRWQTIRKYTFRRSDTQVAGRVFLGLTNSCFGFVQQAKDSLGIG